MPLLHKFVQIPALLWRLRILKVAEKIFLKRP
nr:MAG TPA: hypothetical protein [Caudoviricetes sp.]